MRFSGSFESAQPLPLERASACDLRQGAVNAGGSQVGIPGRGAFGRPIRFPLLDPGTFRVFQRQLELASKGIHGGAGALPGAFRLEAQVADTPPPRGDGAPDGAEVAAVGVLLIQPTHDVRRNANERTQGYGGLDAVLASAP